MSSRIYFKGSRADAHQVVRRLKATLAGRGADTQGLARGVFDAIGFAALSDVKSDFVRKARGGTGEDGEQWPPLSKEYLAYQRRFGKGEQAALKKAAGLGKGNRLAPGGRKGLLTTAQLKRWRGIYAAMFNRLVLSLGIGAAKARAAQIAWTRLKAEGAKTMLEVYGSRQVEILRDTGVLLNSLSPGELTSGGYQKPTGDGGDEQIFEKMANGVIVGTNVPYAASHNYGDTKRGIPRRQFLPEDPPQVWLDRWSDAAHAAVAEATRLAFLGAA